MRHMVWSELDNQITMLYLVILKLNLYSEKLKNMCVILHLLKIALSL